MINTTNACRKSSAIGAEFARRNGKLSHYQVHDNKLDGEQKNYSKKKSDETQAKEAAELRTNRRSNWCTECNTTKASNGTCFCEE